MKIYNLQQDSTDWLEWRKSGVGGSEIATVVGLNPYASRTELFLQKTYQIPGPVFNSHMRRGKKLEPVARTKYERLYGWKVEPLCISADNMPWVKVSLDGIRRDHQLIAEIKAPAERNHNKVWDDGILDYWYCQVQYQLFASGAKLCHFISYNEDVPRARRLYVEPVEPEPDFQHYIVEEAEKFWREVEDYLSSNR